MALMDMMWTRIRDNSEENSSHPSVSDEPFKWAWRTLIPSSNPNTKEVAADYRIGSLDSDGGDEIPDIHPDNSRDLPKIDLILSDESPR